MLKVRKVTSMPLNGLETYEWTGGFPITHINDTIATTHCDLYVVIINKKTGERIIVEWNDANQYMQK